LNILEGKKSQGAPRGVASEGTKNERYVCDSKKKWREAEERGAREGTKKIFGKAPIESKDDVRNMNRSRRRSGSVFRGQSLSKHGGS